MPDHTLAIVFRNPHPQRSPMRAKLYLLGRDGSSCISITLTKRDSIRRNRSLQAMNTANRCYYPFGRRALVNRYSGNRRRFKGAIDRGRRCAGFGRRCRLKTASLAANLSFWLE